MFFAIGTYFMDKHNLSDEVEQRRKESVKLSSLYLYTSRILQPIFENGLVFTANFEKEDKMYPNIGSTERKRLKLERLLEFIKIENDQLKTYKKDERNTSSSSTRDSYNNSQYFQERLRLESIISQEIDEIDSLKIFIVRCIIALNFVDEISKNSDDFSIAMKGLSPDFLEALKEIRFKDLTKDISVDQALRAFIKKILEVKSENLLDLKEVRYMCENWNK